MHGKTICNFFTVSVPVDEDGFTALHFLARDNNLQATQLLLEAGGDPSGRSPDNRDDYRPQSTCTGLHETPSPLTLATVFGNVAMIELLLESGAHPDQPEEDGPFPLLYSAAHGRVECTNMLLNFGANVNRQGYDPGIMEDVHAGTPLINAVANGHKKCAQILIEAGGSVNAVDPYFHKSVLHFAAEQPNPNLIKMLLRKDATINTKDWYHYQNALQYQLCENNPGRRRGRNEMTMLLYVAGETLGNFTPKCLENFEKFTMCLKDMCRKSICKHMIKCNPGRNMFLMVPLLGLPRIIQEYLLYGMSIEDQEDDTSDESEDIDGSEDTEEELEGRKEREC